MKQTEISATGSRYMNTVIESSSKAPSEVDARNQILLEIKNQVLGLQS